MSLGKQGMKGGTPGWAHWIGLLHRHKAAWNAYICSPLILEACILNVCPGSPNQLRFTRRTHRTQCVVVLTAKTNHGERIQSKISK